MYIYPYPNINATKFKQHIIFKILLKMSNFMYILFRQMQITINIREIKIQTSIINIKDT